MATHLGYKLGRYDKTIKPFTPFSYNYAHKNKLSGPHIEHVMYGTERTAIHLTSNIFSSVEGPNRNY